LKIILIPWPCSNADYEAAVRPIVDEAVQSGVAAMAFGDLFLEDVRAYRERMLDGTGLTPLFPLWGRPTSELAKEMLAGGLKARLTCVDPKVLPRHFAGKAFDAELLADLPTGVDPCGERGEFHSFVTDGPMFHRPVTCQSGEIVERDGFVFADLLPVD
jgi:diphthamide synthase (EF-2-diphthine--ammonia ligase)